MVEKVENFQLFQLHFKCKVKEKGVEQVENFQLFQPWFFL